jgi:hypothetical protein
VTSPVLFWGITTALLAGSARFMAGSGAGAWALVPAAMALVSAWHFGIALDDVRLARRRGRWP